MRPEATGKFHCISGESPGSHRSLSKIVLGVLPGTLPFTVNC